MFPQDVKGQLPNYMNERKSLRNGFSSLPNFNFDGDMIKINDEDDHGKRVTVKSSMGNSKSAQNRP